MCSLLDAFRTPGLGSGIFCSRAVSHEHFLARLPGMFLASSTRLLKRAALPASGMQRGFAAAAGGKLKAVMLNAARLDFDGRMNWDKVTAATDLTKYDISATEEIVQRVQGMDIVMNKEFPIPGDVIRAFPPSVKLIAEAGTGYNNIDLDACREKGIKLCNVPEYTTEAPNNVI